MFEIRADFLPQPPRYLDYSHTIICYPASSICVCFSNCPKDIKVTESVQRNGLFLSTNVLQAICTSLGFADEFCKYAAISAEFVRLHSPVFKKKGHEKVSRPQGPASEQAPAPLFPGHYLKL